MIREKVNTRIFPSTGCGSVVNNTLKGPGYPNKYPKNMDCNYTIATPLNMTMNISFIDFQLEDHSSCG